MYRIFIENDTVIDDCDKNTLSELFGIEYENLIDKEFTGVRYYTLMEKKDMFTAICNADEIFISTSFIGDSSRLLTDMLIGAIDNELKNKTVINLHEYTNGVMWHLNRHHRLFMAHLKKSNHIKFIYGDKDIEKYVRAQKRAAKKKL